MVKSDSYFRSFISKLPGVDSPKNKAPVMADEAKLKLWRIRKLHQDRTGLFMHSVPQLSVTGMLHIYEKVT